MNSFEYIDRTEPESSTSLTPTSTVVPLPNLGPETSGHNASRSLSQLREVGVRIYKDVWTEFYGWEPGYCAQILQTVTQSFLGTKREVADVAKAMVAHLVDRDAPVGASRWKGKARLTTDGVMNVGVDTVTMGVTRFAPSAGHPRNGQTKLMTTTVELELPVFTFEAYEPHPEYESCTPASRSISMDTRYEHMLPFVPYADDDKFPAHDYQTMFDCLEWETPFDPDAEMIRMETIKRLHFIHDIELDAIDRMRIFKKLRCSNNIGLLWEASQRDELYWPGAFVAREMDDFEEKHLPIHTPKQEDLRQRLTSSLRMFCPSLNCLHSLCEAHGQKHTSTYIPSRKPQLTGRDMILSEGVPCGMDCFRHIQDFNQYMESLSSGGEDIIKSTDTLKTILSIAPDLLPCQLAIICLKPCNQVFAQRLQIFPDHHEIIPHEEARERTRRKPRFVDTKSIFHELPSACAHPGPCTGNNCSCFTKQQHCTTMCRCGVKCERQWPGCNCKEGKCWSKNCACAKEQRECIPGICLSCDASGKPCYNSKMQSSAIKPVEIKCGAYGLGAFACQNMSSNAFLGSYVGFMITEKFAIQFQELHKHTTRNYMFEVPRENNDIELPLFDAAYLGNATRYLNHIEERRANVEAKNMIVTGDHQIGFFTNKRVRAGEELFLDYGINYWNQLS